MSNALKALRSRLEALQSRAARNDLDALQDLWEIHSNGVIGADGAVLLRRNAARAQAYKRKSARLGDPGAMTAVADRLANKSFKGRQRRVAIRLYQQAFRAGYATAGYNLANKYKNAGEYRAAVAWYRRALEAGEPSALLELAKAELYGTGIKRNPAAAFAKLQRAARAREEYFPHHWYQCQAMITMAIAMLSGWGVPRNVRAAFRWLDRASRLGSPVARVILEDATDLM